MGSGKHLKSGELKLLLALVTIVLLAGLSFTSYAIQQHQIDLLNHDIASLNNQLLAEQKLRQHPFTTTTSTKGASVEIYTPLADAKVKNPVGIIGEVPSSWTFEATFPIRLEDSKGKVVARTSADVLSDWMGGGTVLFSAKLIYSEAAHGTGRLILEKDNPSGMASNDDSVTIPVVL